MNTKIKEKAELGENGVVLRKKIPWANILIVAGVFVALIVFVSLFYKNSYFGLVDRDSTDIAQIARNISEGRGFTTRFVRPINIAINKSDSISLNELNHPPLYPYIVATLFKLRSPSDQTAIWVSLLFFILTVSATYLLGRSLFDWKTGLLSASVLAVSLPTLKVSISGQEWGFLAFCFTMLLYAIGLHHKSSEKPSIFPGAIYAAASAVLLSMMYMTNRITVFLFIPALIYFAVTGQKRRIHAIVFVVIFAALASWGIYENTVYTGSPVLGINAWDIMADSNAFPKDTLYRSTDPQNIGFSHAVFFPIEHFNAFCEKMMRQTNSMLGMLTTMVGFLVLPFAVVSMLYKFKMPTANAVRGFLYGALPIGIFCFAAYGVSSNSMLIFAPAMSIFASAYLFLLLNAKKLHPVYVKFLICGFMLLTCFSALKFIVFAPDFSEYYSVNIQNEYFSTLAGRGFNQLLYTDVPWVAAWRTVGTAVWVPVKDSDLTDLEAKNLPMMAVILTPESDHISNNEIWYLLHKVKLWRDYIKNPQDGLEQFLNDIGMSAKKAPQAPKYLQRLKNSYPLSGALNGFVPQKTNPLDPDDVQILVKK